MTVFALREKNTKLLFTESMIHRYKARNTPKFYANIGGARRRWAEVNDYQKCRIESAKAQKERHKQLYPDRILEMEKEGYFDDFKPLQFEIVEFELKEVKVRQDYRWQEVREKAIAEGRA